MNATACRRIHAAFVAANGRPPEKAEWRSDLLAYRPSVWRRAKKAHVRAARTSRTVSLPRIFAANTRVELARVARREARDKRRRARL